MNLPYQYFVAVRYLRSKKKHKGISFNTAISIGGVAVGVMALLVVLSVMSGFREDLQKKILGANSHAIVLSYTGNIPSYQPLMEKIKEDPAIVNMSPFVLGQVLVSADKNAHGVFLKGINLATEAKTTEILSRIKFGKLPSGQADSSVGPDQAGHPWIIIGSELSGMLGVLVGDTINVISPAGEIGPLGMLPKIKQFRVAAIFDMGMFEYDANLALTDLKSAQDFFGLGSAVSGIELKLKDIDGASEVRKSLNKTLGPPFFAKDWMQMNKNLFSALKLEKFAMFVILILIVLVASFNIVSTLMMNVVEKQKEIAILKSMGAKNQGIMMIFMLQGLVIGLVGTAMGVVGGYALCIILNNYELIKLPADIYYLSRLPVKMQFMDFVVVSVSAVAISFLSTIYPSYYAARLRPVESLRYE
ncbi:MAG TPA: lipoprotein-releasing ABC transporter permease subunit [Dissulfurispiraceae bacterium]|nr:lipoprotein-releasing ABC transporter permease subunit [Dissulfurispiraceae bacterium]